MIGNDRDEIKETDAAVFLFSEKFARQIARKSSKAKAIGGARKYRQNGFIRGWEESLRPGLNR